MPHAMSARSPRSFARREPAVPSPVLGTIIFVFTEIMFFAGLYSAHTIAESSAPLGWPPPDQPRLPWEETAVNTVALLLSGVFVAVAGRLHAKNAADARSTPMEERDERAALPPLALGLFLGAFFVFAQGVEWVALVREGLTLTSSTHGAFFYLIVGAHGLHALGALVALGWALARLVRGRLGVVAFQAVQVFWFFVVGVWPALYWKVYW